MTVILIGLFLSAMKPLYSASDSNYPLPSKTSLGSILNLYVCFFVFAGSVAFTKKNGYLKFSYLFANMSVSLELNDAFCNKLVG